MVLSEQLSRTWFRFVHGRNIVYNQCWEDPQLDRQALQLTPEHRLVVITSAGCNALDYALAGTGHVHAVDMNPRQNALLELKLAAARELNYDTYFELFGRGRMPRWKQIYPAHIRPYLSTEARSFWDRHGDLFDGSSGRKSFYFRGTSGTFAWLVNSYIDHVLKMRDAVNALLSAQTLEQQRDIYQQYKLAEKLWRPLIRFALRRDITLALLGVPRAQRRQLDTQYPGGILQFVMDRVEAVFTHIPLRNNYFWRVYMTGEYSRDCCPEYLKESNFCQLREIASSDRVTTHSQSLQDFLRRQPDRSIDRFVLLDHMDWLTRDPARKALTEEWQAIIKSAAPSSRVIWRSAGLQGEFVNSLKVRTSSGRVKEVGEFLHYHRELAQSLHARDRVHTYGSFCIADLVWDE